MTPGAAVITADIRGAAPKPSLRRVLWRALVADKLALVALAFLVLLLFSAIFAPLVAP